MAAITAVAALLLVSPAPAGAQDDPAVLPQPGCAAEVSAAVTAASLPGGRWSVADGCLLHEAFYEVELAGYRLVLGLAEVGYDQGHHGRIALASLTAPEGLAASLVGVEDAATGLVRWVYAEGSATTTTDDVRFTGEGISDASDEPATLDLSVSGEGIDLLSAEGGIPGQVREVILDAVSSLVE